jgi:hypothetical protein
MRNICNEDGCKKIAFYNLPLKKKGLYCTIHKKENMINVIKRCIETGCNISASFNKEGSKAIYCLKHKKIGMINVNQTLCLIQECKLRATYNTKGERPQYCSEHKKPEMIDVRHKPCFAPECTKEPSYNFEGKKTRLYCSDHKKDGMINIAHKTCKTPLCSIIIGSKYEGYCFRCFIYTFPEKKIAINYKTKEQSVLDFIKEHFSNYTIISDRKIKDGCSNFRPDILLDFGDQVIIIEIDENKHESYDCSCENKRIMQLSKDIGHRNLVLIRFNPDSYTENTTKITSCWSIDGNGLCVVKKKKEWEERLEALKNQITYWIKNKTDKTVEIIQLFYGSVSKQET